MSKSDAHNSNINYIKEKNMKRNKNKRIKQFNAAAYELFHNGLYKPKIIPNKKKAEQLKRKKVDIKNYQPSLLILFRTASFFCG